MEQPASVLDRYKTLRLTVRRNKKLRTFVQGLVLLGPIGVALARFIPTEQSGIALAVTLLLGLLGFLAAIFLFTTSTDAGEVLDDLLTAEELLQKRQIRIDGLVKSLDLTAAQYSLLQNFSDIGVSEAADIKEIDRALHEQIGAIDALKKPLFGISGREKWNFCVYAPTEDGSLLECVARIRSWDKSTNSRVWPLGKGHVGFAYQHAQEFVYADAKDPALSDVVEAAGQIKSSDSERYVSVCVVPVILREETLGVVVATSSKAGRFEKGSEKLEAIRDWARACEHLLAKRAEKG